MSTVYVIKTRNDEFLCWSDEYGFTLNKDETFGVKRFKTLEHAELHLDVWCLTEGNYKYDIYEVVETLTFIKRGC